MRCGIWCGVKCAVMVNVGVVWSVGIAEMWWCEIVVGGRLRCNVMSDVEYGGPRRDVSVVTDIKYLRDVA